jgi:hypothetical protein
MVQNDQRQREHAAEERQVPPPRVARRRCSTTSFPFFRAFDHLGGITRACHGLDEPLLLDDARGPNPDPAGLQVNLDPVHPVDLFERLLDFGRTGGAAHACDGQLADPPGRRSTWLWLGLIAGPSDRLHQYLVIHRAAGKMHDGVAGVEVYVDMLDAVQFLKKLFDTPLTSHAVHSRDG